jgi:hypothetical protein
MIVFWWEKKQDLNLYASFMQYLKYIPLLYDVIYPDLFKNPENYKADKDN